MDQSVRGDSEGQSASRTVHIHCYSTRGGGGGGRDVCSCVIVRDTVMIIRAAQVPGLIIPSRWSPPCCHQTVWSFCLLYDCEFTEIWWRNKTQLQLLIYLIIDIRCLNVWYCSLKLICFRESKIRAQAKVLMKTGKIRLSIPGSVQFQVWIIQSRRQQHHSRVSWMIVAEVQLSQTGEVGVQSWGQRSTAFLCDHTIWQPAKNITT